MILPASIWNLIFQFDPTYHEKYRNHVLEEIKKVNWRVIWKDELGNERSYCGCNRSWAETICTYWNSTYATYYKLHTGINNPQQCYMTFEYNSPKIVKYNSNIK